MSVTARRPPASRRRRLAAWALLAAATLALSPAILAWATFRFVTPRRRSGMAALIAATSGGAIVLGTFFAALLPGVDPAAAIAVSLAMAAVGGVRGERDLPLAPAPLVKAARRLRGDTEALADPAGERRLPEWETPGRSESAEHEAQVADSGLWAPGFDVTGTPAAVDLLAALSEHALVVGETGSGKTTAALTIARDWIGGDERGALVFLDLKGGGRSGAGPALSRVIEVGLGSRRMISWPGVDDDGNPVVIDPFSEGSADAIVGRVLGAFEWSEPYYRDVAEALVRDTVEAAEGSGIPVDIHLISGWLADPERLLRDCETSENAREVASVWRLGGIHGEKERAALAQRFRSWCRADAGEHARAGGVLLSSLLREKAVVAISAPGSAGDGSAGRWAQLLVRALLQARLTDAEAPTVLVIIDEAQHAGRGAITDLLQQGRGLGLWCVICVQELRAAKEAIGESAFGNARTLLVGRQTADAEEAAALFGSVRTLERSHQVAEREGVLGFTRRAVLTGAGSESWRDVYAIHPDALRGLGPGRFAWVTAGEGGGRSAPGWLAVAEPEGSKGSRSGEGAPPVIARGLGGTGVEGSAPHGTRDAVSARPRARDAGTAILGALADEDAAADPRESPGGHPNRKRHRV